MNDVTSESRAVNRRGLVLLVLACALLVAAPHAGWAAGDPKPELRGQTWDSIKRLPDWSGVWAPSRPPAASRGPGQGPGVGFVFGGTVPLTPKYAAIRDERMAAVRGDRGLDKIPLSNSGLCLPNGTPANMGPVGHEYLFSPGRVTILLENSEIRRIWTDGRPHVPDDVANPSFSGDSIGHWEGDTLVVDTVNIFPEAELFIGMRVTEQTHVKERITRVGNKMRIATVVEDPELFTTPWAYTRWYDHEDGPPIDYNSCTERDRAKKGEETLLNIDFKAPQEGQSKPQEGQSK
jgi:hypothetical protein